MKKFSKIFLCLLIVSLVFASIAIFAGCKNEKASLSNVKLNDGVLSWDSDSIVGKSVDAYRAFVNGVEKRVDLSNDGKKLSVNLEKETTEDKDIEVKVQAEGDKVEIDETIVIRKLPALTVTINNGVFDWSESAKQYEGLGTMIYDVILDGARVASVNETSYKATTGVTHVITVRPRVASDSAFYFSNWSEETQATVLSTPMVSDVDWDIVRGADNNVLSAKALIAWTTPATTSNVTYDVVINGIEYTATEATLDTSKVEGLDVSDGFSISIKAISTDVGISDSATSATRRFISLAAPKNIYIADGTLRFDAVKNAAGYKITGNAGAVTIDAYTDTNAYALNDAATSFTLAVYAVPAEGYEYKPNTSEAIPFNILSKPGVRYVSRSFFIEGTIDNVAAYSVRIQKEVVDENGETSRVEVYSEKQDVLNRIFNQYAFKDEGRYFVAVKSIATEGSRFMDSAYSDEYEVIRLGTVPGLSIEEIPTVEQGEGKENHSGYLSITLEKVKYFADKVTRYQLLMDNCEVSTTKGLTFEIPIPVTISEKEYRFSVRTISDDDGGGSRVILSSYHAVEFYATKFSTPEDVRLNDAGQVVWTMPETHLDYLQVPGQAGVYNNTLADYQVVIAYAPYTVGREYNSMTFPDNLASGRYYVNVYARSKYCKQNLASRETVNLTFEVDDQGRTISKCYDQENALVDLPTKKTTENGTQYTYSVIVLSSDYSGSVEMRRLSAPVVSSFTIRNNVLQWAPVEEAKSYDIYYATTLNGESSYGKLTNIKGATSFAIDDYNEYQNEDDYKAVQKLLASDDGCLINIVAVGNRGKGSREDGSLAAGEVYTYDSRMSENFYFVKLSSPDITSIKVSDNNLTWQPVPNASGYKIYSSAKGVNLLVQELKNASVNISELPSGYYDITIVALGDSSKYFESDRSEVYTFNKLRSMNVSTYGDYYVWRPIEYAMQYQFYINSVAQKPVDAKTGSTVTINGRKYYSFKPTFSVESEEGILVEYQAVTVNGQVRDDWEEYGYEAYEYPCISSSVMSFRQPVVRVEKPVFDGNGEDNFVISSEYHKFSITANVGKARVFGVGDDAVSCTYKFILGGSDFREETNVLNYDERYNEAIQPGRYTVSIAYGANFFYDGVYYLDSVTNDQVKTFTFLRGTTGFTINPPVGTEENIRFRANWRAIEGASGYRYYFELYRTSKHKSDAAIVDDEPVYTSEVADTTNAYFELKLKDVLVEKVDDGYYFKAGEDKLGEKFSVYYDEDTSTEYFYSIKIYVMTIGDNTTAITAYDVVVSEISEIG